MSRTLTAGAAALLLALATPALAAPPAGDGHGDHAEQAHEDAGGHGDEAAHGDAHGEEGDHAAGGHHYYTDDDDHDGTANWLDSDSEQYMVTTLGAHAFNLILYIAIILFFVRRPLGDAMRTRALGIRKQITDSAKERDEAKDRHEEVSARLAKLEDEISTMRADAEADAKAESERMVARAREEADRIAQTAERNIRDEIARARQELRRDAVDLAVQLAEKTLKDAVTAADHKRLAQEFLDSLDEGANANA